MYEIAVEDSFDAAHCLPDHEGSCRRLHGHTYRVRVCFRQQTLDQAGMAMDFRKAKDIVRAVLERLDHQYINELQEFADQPPTAENIARFVFESIKPLEARIWSVSVWETASSRVVYWEGD